MDEIYTQQSLEQILNRHTEEQLNCSEVEKFIILCTPAVKKIGRVYISELDLIQVFLMIELEKNELFVSICSVNDQGECIQKPLQDNVTRVSGEEAQKLIRTFILDYPHAAMIVDKQGRRVPIQLIVQNELDTNVGYPAGFLCLETVRLILKTDTKRIKYGF